MQKIRELSTRTCMHVLCKQKMGQKWEKRSEKAKNSLGHPLARAKKDFKALILKSKLIKYYFEVSVIRLFFKMKKIKN